MKNVSDKIVDKIKTHILYSINIFRKSCPLWDIVEKKYGTFRQMADDNIIWRMRFAYWINKATDTHAVYVILIPCLRQQRLGENAWILGCSTLPVLCETILAPVLQTDVPVTSTLLLFPVHCVSKRWRLQLRELQFFFAFCFLWLWNVDLTCLRPECYGERLHLEVRMWQEAVENYIMKVFLFYRPNLHHIL